MVSRRLVPVRVTGFFDQVTADVVVARKPIDQRLRVFIVQCAVEFGTVAGRQNGDLREAVDAALDLAQRAPEQILRERDLLAQLQRRGLVADTESQDRHGYVVDGETRL